MKKQKSSKKLMQKTVLACAVIATLPTLAIADQATSFTYNGLGLLETIDGPRTDVSDVSTYTYDAQGNLATATNPANHITTVNSVDDYGRPLSVTDVNGVVSTFVYNDRGFLLSSSIQHPTDANYPVFTTTFEYDGFGQITRTTQANGDFVSYEYDATRRLVAIQNSLGERMEYSYDTENNVTAESIKDNQSTSVFDIARTFDGLSRIQSVLQGANPTAEYDYDADDNQTALRDGRQYQTSQSYDSLKRLIATVDPLLGETEFEYDSSDRLTRVTDARDVVTQYTYDAYGNVLQVNSADTGISNFTYDDAGNLLSATDANNQQVTYTYDALNRLTQVNYTASLAENISYTYDDTTHGNFGVGKLTAINDEPGSLSYIYDYRGLLTEKHSEINGTLYRWHYSYDANGRLISLRYPSGRIVRYTRDALGRIAEVRTQSWEGAAEVLLANNFNYMPFGGVSAFTYGNGVQHQVNYDQFYRLQEIIVGGTETFMDLDYAYDLSGNINLLSDASAPQLDQVFDYDALSRLETANGAYGIVDYDYDATGNRLQKEVDHNNQILLETYNYASNSNRLSDKTTSGTTHLFSYDANGNIVNDASRGLTLAYNHANRPYQASTATTSAQYAYNALGQRAYKSVTISGVTTTTHYQYDAHNVMLEANAQGEVLREYIYADGVLLAVADRNNDGDSDADGLDDAWELQYFGDLNQNGSGDFDNDGVSNAAEFAAGSVPSNSASTSSSFIDSDNDGLRDSWEIAQFGDLSQTGGGDPDGDGITNIEEFIGSEDPNYGVDTDGDGLPDNWEITYFGNLSALPTDDVDADGLDNLAENQGGTDPAVHEFLREDNPNLVAYYSFDNIQGTTLPDNVGSMDGVISGAIQTDGVLGSALRFNGNEFVNLGNQDTLFAGADSRWSVSLWFNVDDTADLGRLIAKLGATTDEWEFHITASQKVAMPIFMSPDLSAYRVARSDDGTVTSGQWHHLVMSYDGSVDTNDGGDRFTMHIDGVQQTVSMTSVGSLGDMQGTNANLALGAEVSPSGQLQGTRGLKGKIDQVRFYDRTLTTQEANLLINESLVDIDNDQLPDYWELNYFGNLSNDGAGDVDTDGLTNAQELANNTNPTVREVYQFNHPNLVLAYTMDNVTNNVVADESGNGLTATLQGTIDQPGAMGNAKSFQAYDYGLITQPVPWGTNFTVSFWMAPNDVYNGTPNVAFMFRESLQMVHDHSDPTKYDRFVLQTTNGYHGISLSSPMTPGQWEHLAAVYDGATLTVYRNGVQDGQIPATGTPLTNTNNSALGAGAYEVLGGAVGNMAQVMFDQFRLFNTALSANEIQQLSEEVN